MNHQIMRTARKMAKITQDDLAALLGVNRATISKYETGIIEPPMTQQIKIAQLLDIDIFQLLDDVGIEAYFVANERKKNLFHDNNIILDKEGASAPIDTFIGQFMKITDTLDDESKQDLLIISECFVETEKEARKQALKFSVFLADQSKFQNKKDKDSF